MAFPHSRHSPSPACMPFHFSCTQHILQYYDMYVRNQGKVSSRPSLFRTGFWICVPQRVEGRGLYPIPHTCASVNHVVWTHVCELELFTTALVTWPMSTCMSMRDRDCQCCKVVATFPIRTNALFKRAWLRDLNLICTSEIRCSTYCKTRFSYLRCDDLSSTWRRFKKRTWHRVLNLYRYIRN